MCLRQPIDTWCKEEQDHMGKPMSQVCAWTWKHSSLLSGISSRPLSFEAMIATYTLTDHDLLVRDLDEGQEV